MPQLTDADRMFYRYCLAAETRILMADFTWKELRHVNVGDDIITVSENGGVQWQGERARKWVTAKVLNKWASFKPIVELTLSDGSALKATDEHRVLVESGEHIKWCEVKNLRCDSYVKSRLTRAVRYVQQSSLDHAWLGGLFDGEGSVTGTKQGVGKGGMQRGFGYLTITQLPGGVLQKALEILTRDGFSFRLYKREGDGCVTVHVLGAVRETIAAMLFYRPIRLMRNLIKVIGSDQVRATKFVHPTLLSKKAIGVTEVIDIETTAATFIAEGLVVHNCGLDCCTTYECNQVMDKRLMPGQRKHYEFNMNLLAPLLFMQLRGIRYDYEKAKTKLKRVQRWANVLQDILNRAAGRTLPGIHEEAGAAGGGEGGQAAGGKSHSTRSVCKQAGSGLQVCGPQAGQEDVQEISGQSSAGGAEAGAVSTEAAKGPGRDLIPHDASQGPPDQACSEPGVQESEADVDDSGRSADAAVNKAASEDGEQGPPPVPPTYAHPLIPLIASQLCLAKPRRREEVTTTRTFKNGKTKTTTKTVSTPVVITNLVDCLEFAKESCKDKVKGACKLLRRGCKTAGERGQLAELLGVHLKVNSTGSDGDACWFLYERCGFPKQFQKEGNRITDRLASDDEALLHIWLKTKDKRCKAFLLLRRLLTKIETLRVQVDLDRRIRTAYNVVATKTGRIAAYASPTGNGYNTQTTTKSDRDLFLADPGYDMWQRDLSSADAYTVAAHAAAQGDRTMLDDIQAGLKPAKIVCLLHDHGLVINRLDRDKIKEMCAGVSEGSWLYHASKATVYGSSYGMYERTMSENLLLTSFKKTGTPIYVPPAMCKKLQELYFARYPGIRRWHEFTRRLLANSGVMISPSGLKRMFFSRKDEESTLRDALSHEPQNNTTYSLNRAISKLWSDPENRREDGSLIVEILHQIHDAALFQAPTELREWVATKSDEWFKNPLVIAGVELTIPAGKEYGPNWKEMTKWKVASPPASSSSAACPPSSSPPLSPACADGLHESSR